MSSNPSSSSSIVTKDSIEVILEKRSKFEKLQNPVGRTAMYIAAGRAFEMKLPKEKRLFEDEFAEVFASEYGFYMLQQVLFNLI